MFLTLIAKSGLLLQSISKGFLHSHFIFTDLQATFSLLIQNSTTEIHVIDRIHFPFPTILFCYDFIGFSFSVNLFPLLLINTFEEAKVDFFRTFFSNEFLVLSELVLYEMPQLSLNNFKIKLSGKEYMENFLPCFSISNFLLYSH